jgi:hypothetical protein
MEGQYKASMCKSVLESLEQEAPDLIDALPADAVVLIRSASRGDWIPARVLESIYAAVVLRRGELALQQINRRYTRKAMDLAVFGPLVRGAANIFGGGPKALLRVLPKSWELVTRRCGTVQASFPADGEALVEYVNLPPELRTRGFAVSSEASPMGLLDGLGYEGEVESDLSALAEGRLSIKVRWWKPGAPRRGG